jgi:hypothetical protein
MDKRLRRKPPLKLLNRIICRSLVMCEPRLQQPSELA